MPWFINFKLNLALTNVLFTNSFVSTNYILLFWRTFTFAGYWHYKMLALVKGRASCILFLWNNPLLGYKMLQKLYIFLVIWVDKVDRLVWIVMFWYLKACYIVFYFLLHQKYFIFQASFDHKFCDCNMATFSLFTSH